MRQSLLPLAFFLLLPLGAPASAVPGGSAPALPLRFHHAPLEQVARILSARFGTSVTIAGNARAPITGDFSRLDLGHAMAEAARQAGLVLVPAATGRPTGFCLVPAEQAVFYEPEAAPDAAKRREELLRMRKDLLDQAGQLEQ